MKVQSTNSISFRQSNTNTNTNTSISTNTNKKEKIKDITGPIALGLVVASTAFMIIRTDKARLEKISKNKTKNNKYTSPETFQIEIKNFANNKNVKSLDELSGLEKIKEFINEYQIIMQNPDVKIEHNIQDFSSLLFWGVTGTGKTSAAKGIAKKLNADYIQIDKEFFDSKFVAEGSQNLAGVFDQIEIHAKKDPKKPVVVFMDEIDGTISIDRGSAAHHSEDLINTLKKKMIHLQEECENIIFIGATNKDPNGIKSDNITVRLNPAILSRFKYQIEVALPIKEAILNAWTKLMKTASGKDKFTIKQNETIAQHFYDLGMSYRDIEIIADKLNRLDAVEFCKTRKYHSKDNLITALLNDEKIGYNAVTKQTIQKDKLLEIINHLKESI